MSKYKNIIAAIVIFVSALSCYINTIDNPFVYDDLVFIAGNKNLENPENIKKLVSKKYFGMSGERSYRPVSTLALFVEYSAGGGDTRAFRAFSVLTHAAAAVFAFLFLAVATGSLPVSFFTGLIYAIHPIMSEAVNASSFIEDPLSSLFMFAALFAYAAFRRKCTLSRYAVVGALSLLAMLSKESAAILPLIMLACEFTIGASTSENRKTGLALTAVAFASLAFFLYLRFVAFKNPSPLTAAAWPGGTPYSAFILTSLAFLKYLKLFFMPSGFSIEQCVNAADSAAFYKVVFSLLLHIGFLAIAVVFRKKNRILSFASAFYLIAVLPVSNIIPFGAYIAERYMYIPSFGLALFLVCSFIHQDDEGSGEKEKFLLGNKAFYAFLCCVSVLLISTTVERNRDWQSPLVLWKKAVEVCPESSRARTNYGRRLIEEGNYGKAILHLEKAVRIDPVHYEAWSSLGVACMNYGDMKCAGKALSKAYYYSPSDGVKYNLALYLLKAGRYKKAITLLEEMLSTNPDWEDGKYMLATANLKLRSYDKAEKLYLEVMEKNPKRTSAMGNLGILYIETGRMKEAEEVLRRALEIDPGNELLKKNLSRVGGSK